MDFKRVEEWIDTFPFVKCPDDFTHLVLGLRDGNTAVVRRSLRRLKVQWDNKNHQQLLELFHWPKVSPDGKKCVLHDFTCSVGEASCVVDLDAPDVPAGFKERVEDLLKELVRVMTDELAAFSRLKDPWDDAGFETFKRNCIRFGTYAEDYQYQSMYFAKLEPERQKFQARQAAGLQLKELLQNPKSFIATWGTNWEFKANGRGYNATNAIVRTLHAGVRNLVFVSEDQHRRSLFDAKNFNLEINPDWNKAIPENMVDFWSKIVATEKKKHLIQELHTFLLDVESFLEDIAHSDLQRIFLILEKMQLSPEDHQKLMFLTKVRRRRKILCCRTKFVQCHVSAELGIISDLASIRGHVSMIDAKVQHVLEVTEDSQQSLHSVERRMVHGTMGDQKAE